MKSLELPPSLDKKRKKPQKKEIDIEKLSSQMSTEPFKDKDILRSFIELIKNLKDKLITYDTILSDDASGRLVSLVLRKIINEARKRKGENLSEINTYFLATGYNFDERSIKNLQLFLKGKKPEIKKALVVTEYIETGNSIKRLIEDLEKLSIHFDVAAISIAKDHNAYPTKITRRLYSGSQHSKIGLSFYDKTNLTGVMKNTELNIHSPHPKRINYPLLSDLAAARKDVEILAKELEKLI